MCGIAGYIGSKEIAPTTLERTLHLMKNRGPDHRQWVKVPAAGRNVYFLHSRLSIIDLDSRANQPFERRGVWMAFNGEIYNYKEIRADLEKDGAIFTTSSDTEVLLEAYLSYGEDCVDKFEGMWAFAIYDTREDKLFLSRDRFGEKPLYYVDTGDGIYFASEVKFLKALSGQSFVVNQRQLLRYLVNGYRSLYKHSETYYAGVRELAFATKGVIRAGEALQISRYWTPDPVRRSMSMEEAIAGVQHHLFESLRIRLRADVPLAFCLSGGVDSGAVASIAAKKFGYDVATFSIIDRDERYNEETNILATINDLGCKHTLIHLDCGQNVLERLRQLIAYHDAPVATISYLVHSFLSEAISQSGYRVAFSGTAADELFTGYYDHFFMYLYDMRNHPEYNRFVAEWQEHIGGRVRNPFFKDHRLYFKDPSFRQHIYLDNDAFSSLLRVPFEEGFVEAQFVPGLLRNRMLNELFYEATPVILHEDDLNSMKYSVENRSPFLDRRLFEFAYSIPEEFLIQDGYGKYVLRQALAGILNDKVRLDRHKKGFNAAVDSIVDLGDSVVLDYLLSDGPVFGIVDRDKIAGILKPGRHSDSYNKFVFNFINAKIFLELNE